MLVWVEFLSYKVDNSWNWDLGNQKAKTFLATTAKSHDDMLRAKPINVLEEIPPNGVEKTEYVTLKCAVCQHVMSFEKAHFEQLPEIVCESRAAEVHT